MALRILILGPVSAETAKTLAALEGGAEVLSAPASHQALERLAATPPDVVALGEPEPRLPRGGVPFEQLARNEFARSERYGHPLAVLALALDRPEALEEAHGGSAVDAYVASLEDALRRSIRQMDLLARTGDHELFAILPETAATGARIVAERARGLAAGLIVKRTDGRRPALPLKALWSAGIAAAPAEGIGRAEDLLARARQALDAAHASGGDRVAAAVPLEP